MTKPIHFEKAMTDLQSIVQQLEKGELPLEDSLKQFEQGITLAKHCQDILNQAEQKIEQISSSKTPTHENASDE
jgi:exodeoxyribonuclease VII small subunit